MSAQISLRELRERATPTTSVIVGRNYEVLALAISEVLALVEAVEAAAIAVPISCCDTDICPDPPRGICQGSPNGCVRIKAMEALARFKDYGEQA